MFTLLSQRRLRWLGHASRMEDGRIAKDIFYDAGPRPAGRSSLRFKDVCKRDLTGGQISTLQPRTQASLRYLSDQRRLGTERDSPRRTFPTSLTGDVTSEIAEDDWEKAVLPAG